MSADGGVGPPDPGLDSPPRRVTKCAVRRDGGISNLRRISSRTIRRTTSERGGSDDHLHTASEDHCLPAHVGRRRSNGDLRPGSPGAAIVTETMRVIKAVTIETNKNNFFKVDSVTFISSTINSIVLNMLISPLNFQTSSVSIQT
jgi:hypothetical protein